MTDLAERLLCDNSGVLLGVHVDGVLKVLNLK
jgi:hypothetical protein